MDQGLERMCENVHKGRGEQEGDESRQRAQRQRNENQKQTLSYAFIYKIDPSPKAHLFGYVLKKCRDVQKI